MSITIASMIATPRLPVPTEPAFPSPEAPSRLIPHWNLAPGSRLIPRWTRLHVYERLSQLKMYAYTLNNCLMATTKIFKNGNSQAVRIPAELAYSAWDIDLIIGRQGDELRIRPAQRRMGDVMAKLAKFSPDFMVDGRPGNEEGERAVL